MMFDNSEFNITDDTLSESLDMTSSVDEALFDLFVREDDDEDDDDFDDDDEEEEKKAPINKSKDNSQLADVNDDLPKEEGQKSSKLKLLILILVLFLGGGVSAYFLFSGKSLPKTEVKLADSQIKKSGPPVYVKFPQEEIVAIVEDANGQNHHVIVQVVLLTRDENLKGALENNSALIISEFLELMETQNYEELLTYDGKLELRNTMLKHLQKTIPDFGFKVEAVLITKFLMD